MDTTKLSVGMEFQNLQKLANFIEVELPSVGKSRILKMAEWERYFKWEKPYKKKHTIRITELNNAPISKDVKIGSRAIYVKHIEVLIMQMLAETPGESLDISKKALWYDLGFYNDNYNSYEHELLFLNRHKDISSRMVSQFKNRAYKKFDEILTSALKSLTNRRLIDWRIDVILTNKDSSIFKATDAQRDMIRQVEHRVLKQLGYVSINQIWIYGLEDRFYTKVAESLEDEYGWVGANKVINIRYTENTVKQELEAEKIKLEKLALNQLIQTATDQQAITQYSNHLKKIEQQRKLPLGELKVESTPEFKKNGKSYYPGFVEIQGRLSQEFIHFIGD